MTWTAPQITRQGTTFAAGERQMLDAWLDFHRQTLLSTCSGLTAEQLRQRSAPSSTMSLLGLVRHMTDVERGWFRRRWRCGHRRRLARAGYASSRISAPSRNRVIADICTSGLDTSQAQRSEILAALR